MRLLIPRQYESKQKPNLHCLKIIIPLFFVQEQTFHFYENFWMCDCMLNSEMLLIFRLYACFQKCFLYFDCMHVFRLQALSKFFMTCALSGLLPVIIVFKQFFYKLHFRKNYLMTIKFKTD